VLLLRHHAMMFTAFLSDDDISVAGVKVAYRKQVRWSDVVGWQQSCCIRMYSVKVCNYC